MVTDGLDRLREGSKVTVIDPSQAQAPAADRPRADKGRALKPTAPAMNLSRLFILRPIATSLLMVAILIAGLLAWRQLPISALPGWTTPASR